MSSQDGKPAIELVIDMGRALHAYGTSSHRLEEALDRLSGHLGLSGQFFSTPTAIFASFGGSGAERTILVRAEPGSTDLEKLTQTEEVLHGVVGNRLDVEAARQALQHIASTPPRYGRFVTTLAFALASGSAARFLGGGLGEIAVAACLGLAIGLVGLATARRPNAQRLFEVVGAFLSTAIATTLATELGGGSISPTIAALAGMIVLVPGLTLTMAMSELGARHLVSGSARLSSAVVTFLLIAFGVALGQRTATTLFGPAPESTAVPLAGWTEFPALAITAIGLTVLFRARPRDYPWVLSGVLFALHGSRLGSWLLGAEFAPFIGAFLLAMGAHLGRRFFGRPSALFQVPGLMVLVPGSIGFRSVSALLSGDVLSGVQAAFTATLVAVSLVTGLLLANVLIATRRLV